jgi:hypothetical protein
MAFFFRKTNDKHVVLLKVINSLSLCLFLQDEKKAQTIDIIPLCMCVFVGETFTLRY